MNARKDNLLITVIKEFFHLLENRHQGYTAATTSGIGDYTIGAESVAAVLGLEKGPSSVGKGCKDQRGGIRCITSIFKVDRSRSIFISYRDIVQECQLFAGSKYVSDPGDG